MIVHLLVDEDNPYDGSVWTMVCGEKCIVLDDGTLIPPLDFVLTKFYSPDDPAITCLKCRRIDAPDKVKELYELAF